MRSGGCERKRRSRAAQRSKAVAERYFARAVKQRQKASTAKETLRNFEKDLLPPWGNRDIASITRKDVQSLVDRIVDRGAPATASIVLAQLRAFCRWALKQEYIDKD